MFFFFNSCPLWSDDRRLNAESVIKVCQETVKQMKEKDPQIDINVDALLPKLPPKSKGPHDDIVYNAMVHISSGYLNKYAYLSGLKYEYYINILYKIYYINMLYILYII